MPAKTHPALPAFAAAAAKPAAPVTAPKAPAMPGLKTKPGTPVDPKGKPKAKPAAPTAPAAKPVAKSPTAPLAQLEAFTTAAGTLPAGLAELLTTFTTAYKAFLAGDPATDPAATSPADGERAGAAPVAKSAFTGRDLANPAAARLTAIWAARAVA
jgi:hypothetical protein